eukprot:271398-Rhodomonas_salina.1
MDVVVGRIIISIIIILERNTVWASWAVTASAPLYTKARGYALQPEQLNDPLFPGPSRSLSTHQLEIPTFSLSSTRFICAIDHDIFIKKTSAALTSLVTLFCFLEADAKCDVGGQSLERKVCAVWRDQTASTPLASAPIFPGSCGLESRV